MISRIIQNLKICRKAKLDLKLATFAKSEKDLLDEKQIKAIEENEKYFYACRRRT